MLPISQAQSFSDIRLEGQGHTLTINQVIQIAVAEVKTRPFLPRSPYRGLQRFDVTDKDLFFGRDQLVAQLLTLVSQRNLVLVAGASGSGKSSVVRAGLLPQLSARLHQGLFKALTFTPDRDPFQSLRGVLNSAAGVPQEDLDALDARTAESLVTTLTAQRPSEALWLLCIDQFEEIFTRCTDAERRKAFLLGLTELAKAPQSEIKIVLAMRADFFDRFGPHPEFGALAQQGIQLALDMQPSELRAAIEQPAARHGVVFEERLVEQIIADVQGRPGALPLLQYMLDLLWREDKPEDDRTLNTNSYHRIGGVEGALKQHADMIYRFASAKKQIERSPSQQEVMRQIFLRIVDLTSAGAEARAVSRRASVEDFSRAEDRQLISELVEEKLLVSNAPLPDEKGLSHGSATIELAHEALLSAWPRLGGWIEQAREVIYVRNRLSTDARHFSEVKKRAPSEAADELWGGTRLAQALQLRARGDFATVLGGLSHEESSFLDASDARKALAEREAAERLQRERDAAEKTRQLLLDTYIDRGHQLLFEKNQPYSAILWLHRAYKQDSKNPNLPHLLKSALRPIDATIAILSHEGSVLSAMFSPDGRHILTGGADGRARVWDAVDGHLLTELTGHGHFVHIARYSPDGHRILVAARSDCGARVWDAEDGRLLAELTGHVHGVLSARYSPDGRRILTASRDHTARVWDAEDGRLLTDLTGHGNNIHIARYSPDGRRILTASEDHTARVWDAEDGHLLADLRRHWSYVLNARYSPDGRRILTASRDDTARLLDAEDGRLLTELTGHGNYVLSARYSPDGRRILTASSDNTARIWDAEDGHLLTKLTGHGLQVLSARYSPDGRRILTASSDHTARVWDAEHGHLLSEFPGHGNQVLSARYSPDGWRILTASSDNTARVWDANHGRHGRLLTELTGHGNIFQSVRHSPDGRRILTASSDSTARVWDAEDGHLLTELTGHGRIVQSARYSPDGRRILTASDDSTARVWDSEDGHLLTELTGHGGPVRSARYSPDGRRILTASSDNTARVWDAEYGRLLAEFRGHGNIVQSARYSPDGRCILTVSWDNTARVWDAEHGRLMVQLGGHGGGVIDNARYSPDGRHILTVSKDHKAQVRGAADGQLVFELTGHGHSVVSARYSPDGRRILTASEDQTARVWDAEHGHLLAQLMGHEGSVQHAMFSPDGRRIVTASSDQTARVWDAEHGHLLAQLTGHEGSVRHVMFSPDGRRIVTISEDKTARVWDVSQETRTPEQLAQVIRSRSCVRFEPEDGNVIVPCTPPPTENEDKRRAFTAPSPAS